MNYYPRFPGDYMRKTMHLSMLEDGAYTRLLDWYYANDRAIPHDRRYAVSRATSSAERTAVDAVLCEFFVTEEGHHRNLRADTEIAAAAKRIEAAKLNGSKGGRKPKTEPDKNPVGSNPLTQDQSSLSPNSLRSEEKEPDGSSSSAKADDSSVVAGLPCPHDDFRRIYAEKCPELSAPKHWNASRQAPFRSRWAEIVKSKGWATQAEGIAWLERFFDAVQASDFLMGRVARTGSHKGWRCDADFLISPTGFWGVVEGKYDNRAAA